MNIFKKIWRWLFGKKKVAFVGALPPVESLPKITHVDEVVKDSPFKPRSMTAYERQIYYGMGYKQFEKYKRLL